MPGAASDLEPMLRCRECGADAPAAGPQYCGWCFGPVEVLLPDPAIEPAALRAVVSAGPPSLGRYRPLLPAGLDLNDSRAGWTPLVGAPELGSEIGIPNLWIKDETANPTGSFKDRVVETAVARATAIGLTVVACSSTGNLARATAAAADRRGLASVLLVPDDLDPAAVAELVSLGAVVVLVRGGYDAASRLAADAASDLDRWAWVNVGLRPWYELGARTVGWEIVEQFDWQVPDRVAVPIASGALARATHDAIGHLLAHGVSSGEPPRLTALQPAGCAPVALAFDSGAARVRPIAHPDTVAESLAMGDPPDGDAVLAAARATDGAVGAAAEDAIGRACELVLATTGIAVEPAGGVVVAGLADLARSGAIDPAERVVAVLTGTTRDPATRAGVAEPKAGMPSGSVVGSIDASVGALRDVVPDELLR
jgi:threonine synthase